MKIFFFPSMLGVCLYKMKKYNLQERARDGKDASFGIGFKYLHYSLPSPNYFQDCNSKGPNNNCQEY